MASSSSLAVRCPKHFFGNMKLQLLFLDLLAICSQAFSPAVVCWGGLPAKRLILAPGALPNTDTVQTKFASPAPNLRIQDQKLLGSASSKELPSFVRHPDGTLTLWGTDFCVEAIGIGSGQAVRINHCSGGLTQAWKFLPQGNKRQYQIQLIASKKCMSVDDAAGLNGARIELQECDRPTSKLWQFEECEKRDPRAWMLNEPWTSGSQTRPAEHWSSARATLFAIIVILMLGALSLNAAMGRWQKRAYATAVSRGRALSSPEQGGVCLCNRSAASGSQPVTPDFEKKLVVSVPSPTSPAILMVAGEDASNSPRMDFSGEWKMDLRSSDALGPILRELGINRIVAAAVARLPVSQSIRNVANGVAITVKTALGTDELDLRTDGTLVELPALTGKNSQALSTWLDDGRLKTAQSLGTGGPLDPEADLFITIRCLESSGTSLSETISIVRGGTPVPGMTAKRILRRTTPPGMTAGRILRRTTADGLHGGFLKTTALAPVRGRGRCIMLSRGGTAPEIVTRCAQQRDVPASDVLQALEELEQDQSNPCSANAADFEGCCWDLVWSSAVAKIPFLGGYMPNRELLTWDLTERRLDLEIETLPFLPKLRVVGKDLAWDEAAQTLSYSTDDQKPRSQWRIISVDRENGVIAARSSVTGLNVIRRSKVAVTPMAGAVDPQACMGTWYVQRQIPALAFLEAGARNGVEQYDWDAASGCFSVRYTFNRAGQPDDSVTTVRQRGWVASEMGTEWQVAPVLGGFCLPVRLPFILLDVDPGSHLVCTGGPRSWMYVLTRERQPDPLLIEALMQKVESAGFDLSKVLPVEHA